MRRCFHSTPQLYYMVLYTTLRTQLSTPNSTQTQLYSTAPTHHPVFSPQSATRSTPSLLSWFNPKDSPPEGRRMKQGHDTPCNIGSPGTKKQKKVTFHLKSDHFYMTFLATTIVTPNSHISPQIGPFRCDFFQKPP